MRGVWTVAIVFLAWNINPASRRLVIKITCKPKDPNHTGLCHPPVNLSPVPQGTGSTLLPSWVICCTAWCQIAPHLHSIHTPPVFCHFRLFWNPNMMPQLKVVLPTQGHAHYHGACQWDVLRPSGALISWPGPSPGALVECPPLRYWVEILSKCSPGASCFSGNPKCFLSRVRRESLSVLISSLLHLLYWVWPRLWLTTFGFCLRLSTMLIEEVSSCRPLRAQL